MNYIKSQLILLEHDDLLQDFKGATGFPKNIIIQNPFKGLIKFVESESDKLQVLINATYNMDYYQRKDEVIKYAVSRNNDELNIKILPDVIPSNLGSYQTQSIKSTSTTSTGIYEPDFLPLYVFISIALFCIMTTFILSSIFAVWWNKNKRPDITKTLHYKVDTDSTKHPLLTSEPNTPHLHEQIYGNFISSKDALVAPVNSPDLTSGNCPTLQNTLRLLEQQQQQFGAFAAASTSSIQCNSPIQGLTGLNQSTSVAGITAENMPFVLTGVFDDYPVQNLDLMTSINAATAASTLGGTILSPTTTLAPDGSTYSTLPLAGLNLLYTSQASQSLDRNNNSQHFINPANTVAIAAVAAASSNFTKPIITASNQSVSLPRHLPKEFMEDNFIDRINVLSQISEKDVADFNSPPYTTLLYSDSKPCPLDANGGMYQQQLNNTGQGSDETSGILSDSSGSTLDRPAQCSNAKISAGFSIVPSVISSNERYVSLDANDQRYVPLSNVMIAEVAQCPQHSYLVKTGAVAASSSTGVTQSQQQQPHATQYFASNPGVIHHGAIVHGYSDSKTISTGNTGNTSPYEGIMGTEDILNERSGTVPRPMRNTPKPPKRDGSKASGSYYEVTKEKVDEDGDDDDARTTLSSSPKSAMKGSRSSSRVSKQLRFTTLGLFGFITCMVLGICVDPISSSLTINNESLSSNYMNYYLDNSTLLTKEDSFSLTKKRSNRDLSFSTIEVTITIYVPNEIWMVNDRNMNGNGNKKEDEKKIVNKDGILESFESFRLYFNESSQTRVDIGNVNRKYVEIYDIRNSFNIQSPSLCIQRYSCKHSCDPGNGHKCICQRGYILDPANDNACNDINECQDPTNPCGQFGGRCVNFKGTFKCLCGSDNQPCRDCNEKCPAGYFKKASCHRSKYLQCQKCKDKCSPGYYVSRKCTEQSDTHCVACRPLCITGEFELSPCSGNSNRVCKTISNIPGIELPNKKNVWYEDRRGLTDISRIISNDESRSLRTGRVIKLERQSGYQIHLELLDAITLEPILEPVDHSQSNDNRLFLSDPGNSTMTKFCPYPVPPKYSLNMMMHYNVTTDVVNDPGLPGYRAALHPCKTHREHGVYPDPVKSITEHFKTSVYDKNYHSLRSNVISCLDPGKLPAIFGDAFNEELAIRDGIYVEEKLQCQQKKVDCQRCLENCAHTMIGNSLVCQPTGGAADNGRSPRLEMCFDCCAKDNCTSICKAYSKGNCAMHLCMTGPRMDLSLEPKWPENDRFICHMKLSDEKPIIKFKWTILKDNKKVSVDEYEERLLFTSNNNQNDRSNIPVSNFERLSPKVLNDISQVYRNLLHVTYSSNIGTLPDIITGNTNEQNAALWNTERLPLATSSARLRPDKKSATIEVWPHQPLLVNSGMWGSSSSINDVGTNSGYYSSNRLSLSQQRHLDCRDADRLVGLLNNYTERFPTPYSELTNLRIKQDGHHRYSVVRPKMEPRINITIPASASLIGAIFKLNVYVERREGLSASLVYINPNIDSTNDIGGTSMNSGYWIIDVAGQVNSFPGYFQLQLWDGDIQMSPQKTYNTKNSQDGTQRGEQPLLDYDIGVYEEHNFQLQLRVPAPESQPNFDKTFLVRILDVKGRLDLFVHRAEQDPDKILQIERYSRAQNGKYTEEPSILPEVMAVSGEKSLRETSPLGIPRLVMFTVVIVLSSCLVLLLLGHLTRKEEHLCEDIMFKSRHLIIFVLYMVLKASYCFCVTTTAVLIFLVIYTREPYMKLTAQTSEYSNNTVAERLLMGRMDAHLETEITRQLNHVAMVKDRCDNRLKKYYERLNVRLEEISQKAAKRRSRVLISQAVVERAQYELKNVVDELTRNLEDFNKTAKIYMKKIEHDMKMTKKKLTETEWLEGARLIYKEVLKKRRGQSSEDPTKPFLSWLSITGELPESAPRLTLPSNIPLPDWSSLDVEVPQPRVGSGLDAEYGPEYQPFTPKEKDLELEQSIWSYYEPPQDNRDNPSPSSSSSDKSSSSSSSSNDNNGIMYMESVEAIYNVLTQLTWHHLLAVTLLLDTLWLLHRAAHTVDTAEQIIYGYPCFIDCTAKGKRRRKRNENNFKFMLKRTFCETMESTFVPKFCASAFALFMLYLLSNHLNELISEEALDFVGYYDNMALPAHLRNRFVNTQLVQSAQQLNEYELSSYEQFVHQRQSEIQDILNSWVNWTSQLQQYQCDILKHYKMTPDGKLISDILNKPNKVPIPSHCQLNEQDRLKEMEQMADFKMTVCPVKLVIPQLFTEYNETAVSMQIVQSSRHWLKWTRQWVDVVLQCVFGFVSAMVLWNTIGATLWFFIKRFSLIRQKRIYETDFHALPTPNEESNLKSSSNQ